MIEKFFKAEEETVVMSLASEPEVQLEYLEKMLEGREQGDTSDKMLNLHIELLCQLKDTKGPNGKRRRNNILQALQSNYYPQDACLEICKKYQIKEAWAYLERKRGGPAGMTQAINLQFEVKIKIYCFLGVSLDFRRVCSEMH